MKANELRTGTLVSKVFDGQGGMVSLCVSRICLWLGMLSPLLCNDFYGNKNGAPWKSKDMSGAWVPLLFNGFARKSEGIPLEK